MGPVQGRSAVIALTLTAVVAAGCGSSSSTGGLSKQQLGAKANSICSGYKPKIAAVKAPSISDIQSGHYAPYFDQIAPIYDQAIAQLKTLKPASNVQGQWNQMLAQFGAVTTLIDQVRTRVDKGQGGAPTLLAQVVPRTNAADAAAKNIGATACASTPTQSGGG